jgi:hypothetical protein
MTKIWTSPETGIQVNVMIVAEYDTFGEKMFTVHKATATSSKYVFGVKQSDCRDE